MGGPSPGSFLIGLFSGQGPVAKALASSHQGESLLVSVKGEATVGKLGPEGMFLQKRRLCRQGGDRNQEASGGVCHQGMSLQPFQ